MNYTMLLRYAVLAEAILDVKLNIEKPNNQNKIDFNVENKQLSNNVKKPIKIQISCANSAYLSNFL